MRVERFMLFFPPILAKVRRGETEYGIGAVPLGGYVKITGMTPHEELTPEVAPRAYLNMPVWKRVVVIGAGPFVNVVIAFLIIWALFVANGIAHVALDVDSVSQGGPAAAAPAARGSRAVSGRDAGLRARARLRGGRPPLRRAAEADRLAHVRRHPGRGVSRGDAGDRRRRARRAPRRRADLAPLRAGPERREGHDAARTDLRNPQRARGPGARGGRDGHRHVGRHAADGDPHRRGLLRQPEARRRSAGVVGSLPRPPASPSRCPPRGRWRSWR